MDLRRRPQAADGRLPPHGDVHRPHPRPRPRPGDDGRERRGGPCYYARRRPLDVRNLHRGRSRCRSGCTRPAGAHADRAARRGRCRPGGRRRPRGVHRDRAADPVPRRRLRLFSAPTRWAPAGWAPTRQSVADPCGELHDTKGVWIGDGSAFPTSSGTNPMISIMALAHRTAEAIATTPAARPSDRRSVSRKETVATEAPSGAPPPSEDRPRPALHRRRVGRARRRRTIEVVNATTEEVMGRVPRARRGRRPRGRRRARRSRRGRRPCRSRTRLCAGAISRGLAERADEIAALIAREVGMPMRSGAMIQAGLPTMDFGSMAQLVGDVAWEEQVGNSLVVREPVGVVGAITPWNYPLHQIVRQGRAGAGGRLHGRAQAERGDAAERVRPGRDHRRGRPARRASSTSSPATARSSARRSPRTPASTWSRSPARPAPASGERARRRRRSSGSRSSWAASRPT